MDKDVTEVTETTAITEGECLEVVEKIRDALHEISRYIDAHKREVKESGVAVVAGISVYGVAGTVMLSGTVGRCAKLGSDILASLYKED